MENVMEYVAVDYYRIDNEPLRIIAGSELPAVASLLMYCSVLCLQTFNCKALSTKYDSSMCKLYDVSLDAPGVLAVYDVNWRTFHGK